MKVGIVFGCFIPWHKGHQYLFACAQKENDVVVVGVCGHKNDRGEKYLPFDRRVQLVRMKFKDDPNVIISVVDDDLCGCDGTFTLSNWESWSKLLFKNAGMSPDENVYTWYTGDESYKEKLQTLYPAHKFRVVSRDAIPVSGTMIRNGDISDLASVVDSIFYSAIRHYKTGFYGGKFMPFHKGHDYCIRVAAAQCDVLHVILFYGGDDELAILENASPEDKKYLSLESRLSRLKEVTKDYGNVKVSVIDVTDVKNPDGSEDWDGETPLVLAVTGKMDAVYSSEYDYGEYFARAYPWAVSVYIDPPRETYDISGTRIRNLNDGKGRLKWVM